MAISEDILLRLLLKHRAMVLGYIISIVRDSGLAEDILQDVSLLALKKKDSINDEQAFPAWIRRTARFEALNAVRRQKKLPQPVDDEVLDLLDEEWSAADTMAPAGRAVEALRNCIDKLTPRAQKLVKLRYFEELSGKRLAEKLGRPVNTVYVALTRIHKNLSSCVRLQLQQPARN